MKRQVLKVALLGVNVSVGSNPTRPAIENGRPNRGGHSRVLRFSSFELPWWRSTRRLIQT